VLWEPPEKKVGTKRKTRFDKPETAKADDGDEMDVEHPRKKICLAIPTSLVQIEKRVKTVKSTYEVLEADLQLVRKNFEEMISNSNENENILRKELKLLRTEILSLKEENAKLQDFKDRAKKLFGGLINE